MPQVFKESEYYSEYPNTGYFYDNPEIPVLGDLKADFMQVLEAGRNFPIRSTLTMIGLLTVVYIAFRFGKMFVKMKK